MGMRKVFWAVVCLVFLFVAESAGAASSAQARRNLQTLLDTRECENCDLSGLDLSRKDLSYTNLKGADLSLTICNLTDFAYANLQGAKLNGAKMIGADMEGTDLRHADLRGTSMESVFLGDALTDGMQRGNVPSGAALPKKIVNSGNNLSKRAKPAPSITRNRAKQNATNVAAAGGKSVKVKTLPKLAPLPTVSKAASSKSAENTGKQDLKKGENQPLMITALKRKRRKAAMEHSVDENGKIVLKALRRKRKIVQQTGKATVGNTADAFFPKKVKEPVVAKTAAETTVSLVKQPQVAPVTGKSIAAPVHGGAVSDLSYKTNKLPNTVQGLVAQKQGEKKKITLQSVSLPQPATVVNVTKTEKVIPAERPTIPELSEPTVQPLLQPVNVRVKSPQLMQLLETGKCYGCDLAGLDLSGKSFAGADLERANLSGCNLQETNLRGANLKAAQLMRAQMQRAKLDGADLYKADLSHANLTDASITDTDFDSCRRQGVVGLMK